LIVVDASVLVDFLLGRPQAIDALDGAMSGREHEHLHAPDLIEPEALNALRRLVRRGAIAERRAGEAVGDLANTRLLRHAHQPLRGRVWELRESLTGYDATYVALAEVLDDPLLLTGDGGLATIARASLGGDRVREIP
jgi:predicted nucleic acid-binding protein